MPIDLTVADYIGINNDIDAIHLGTTIPGSTPERKITITSAKDATVILDINDIEFVHIDTSTLTIPAHQTATITIYADVPDTAPYGYYKGTLRIISKRP